ncbi:MAG: hypothetical protein RIC30_01740 [Marinoscillum sp.]|uniref:hypothetical protein n=1 Tax=Marinoscillum sp. TaxID=2024838 RepID=UPI0032FB39AE
MNIKNLNQAFVEIAEKKNQLFRFAKEGSSYHDLQEEVKRLEEDFQMTFGAYIEEALFNVHDEYCPDNEVLKPLSYLASHYEPKQGTEVYDVDPEEGIEVEADDFPGIKAKLVLVPGPTRLVLQGLNADFKETVWVARQPLEA